ncbi:MAG: diguanylate cyclase [Cellulosilyticaceae bacterium]
MRFKTAQIALLMILLTGILSILGLLYHSNTQAQRTREFATHYVSEFTYWSHTMASSSEDIRLNYKQTALDPSDPLSVGILINLDAEYEAFQGNYEQAKALLFKALTYHSSSPYGQPLVIRTYLQGLITTARLSMDVDSILFSYPLLDLVQDPDTLWITKEEKIRTQAYVYANLLTLFSKYNLMEKATQYYDALTTLVVELPDLPLKYAYVTYALQIYHDANQDFDKMRALNIAFYEANYIRNPAITKSIAATGFSHFALEGATLDELVNTCSYLESSLAFCEQKEDLYGIANTSYSLANCYLQCGNYKQALASIERAITLYLELADGVHFGRAIDFVVEHSEKFTSIDLSDYYKAIYHLYSQSDMVANTQAMITNIIDINDKLNADKLAIKQREHADLMAKNIVIKIGIWVLITISISLTFMIYSLRKQVRINRTQNAQLNDLLNRDYLTGCTSKATGLKYLDELIAKNTPFSLAIVDIDNFKQLNDQHGHLFGDHVLSTLGTLLLENIGKQDFVIRFGGEEFIIVYHKTQDEAWLHLDATRELIAQTVFKEFIQVSISGGIVSSKGESTKELIEAADRLLYRSKSTGKNKITL